MEHLLDEARDDCESKDRNRTRKRLAEVGGFFREPRPHPLDARFEQFDYPADEPGNQVPRERRPGHESHEARPRK